MSGRLSVRSLGKCYRRYSNRWKRLVEWLWPPLQLHEPHWVLRGLDFEVGPGDAVAVLGHNGAGKSTLLKIIAGTTRPTEGSVEVTGRVAALLELGIGFHPELTGRQNVTMAGQLMGLSEQEIRQQIPDIAEFAEIGDYLEQPLRTYSSGMQVRLAFSVATCVRPDILIVDEALSVGDAYFQFKCFDRIRAFRDAGTTLLFVSHSLSAIKALCSRAILLDAGTPVRDGPVLEVLDYYNAVIARRTAGEAIEQDLGGSGAKATRSGGCEARIEKVTLLDGSDRPIGTLRTGDPATVAVDFVSHVPLPELTVGILIRDAMGNDIFGTNTFHHRCSPRDVAAGTAHRVRFAFTALGLGLGEYNISCALHARDSHVAGNYDWWDHALAFQVLPGDRAFSIGVCDLEVAVDVAGRGAARAQAPT